MVVVPEPAVKCHGAFAACAVDRAVGPAGEECADEAFGFAVGLWPVWPGAEVSDAELAAGDRVQDGAVGGAVVGKHALDADPVAGKEGDRATEKGGGGRGSFVEEHFGVGEAAVVIDGDVHVLPAGDAGDASVDPCLCLAGPLAADPVAD